MKQYILPSIRLTLVCLVFFSGIYTLVILGISQATPNNGKGFTITDDARTYYENVGQKFTDDKYFNSRPSAVDYNAAGSGGSNKGPSNPDYLAQVQARIDTLMVHNPGILRSDIPSDLVTASGSGLDPQISTAAALMQVSRIAKSRSLSDARLRMLVIEHTKGPWLGLFGTSKVHVLKLNIALDKLSQSIN